MSSQHTFGLFVARLCGTEVQLPPRLDEITSRLVTQHRLAPLAYRLGYANHKAAFINNAVLAEMREGVLAEVGGALANVRVQACLLKGIAYSHGLYEDPAERMMGDIDLLIPPLQFAQAIAAVGRLGFSPRPGKYTHLASTHHAITLDRGNVSLDLHRSMTQPWRNSIDISGIWGRVLPTERAGGDFYTLDTIDAIVMHCAHIARHELMAGVLSYVDLARLENLADVSREQTLTRAKSFRLERSAKAVLQMADSLREMKSRSMFILPSTERVLLNSPLSRGRQIGAKFCLLDGPVELAGLLGVAAYERWFPHSKRE